MARGLDSADLERASRGEAVAVDVGAIERELGALWRSAWRDAGAAPVTRAALWNIIVPVQDGEPFVRAKSLIDSLAPLVPARVIVLRHQAGAAEGEREIEATIETNAVSTSSGGHAIRSEEITLTGRGAGADHFPSLVRALLVPDLPTVVLALEDLPARTRGSWELVTLSDRLIIDTGHCRSQADLTALHGLLRLAGRPAIDLGWLRLSSLRLLFAGLFGPPVGGAPLRQASRLVCHRRPDRTLPALLLVGWFADRLGWHDAQVRRSKQPGAGSFRFSRPDGEPVDVDLLPRDGEGGTNGICRLELRCGDRIFWFERKSSNTAELGDPIAPSRTVRLDPRGQVELCRAALGTAGSDPLFGAAFDAAAALAALG